MNNLLTSFHVDLNLETLSLKLQEMKAFINFHITPNTLHCEHFGYNLDFNKNGSLLISLPVEPICLDDFDQEESIAYCLQTQYLVHEEHTHITLDDCLQLAKQLINNPLELN